MKVQTNRSLMMAALLCTAPLLQMGSVAGYIVCEDPQLHEQTIVCDGKPCPIGMTKIAYNDGPCPNSGGGGNQDLGPGAQLCVESRNLHDLDYKSGNKTRKCKLEGFDGSHGWTCTRDCSKPCVRANIIRLGWSQGDKTHFCKNLGYDGVHSPKGSDYSEGGYCYQGDPKICANN